MSHDSVHINYILGLYFNIRKYLCEADPQVCYHSNQTMFTKETKDQSETVHSNVPRILGKVDMKRLTVGKAKGDLNSFIMFCLN